MKSHTSTPQPRQAANKIRRKLRAQIDILGSPLRLMSSAESAVLTSQMAGAWLDYILRKGWPLLRTGASLAPEAAAAQGRLSTI